MSGEIHILALIDVLGFNFLLGIIMALVLTICLILSILNYRETRSKGNKIMGIIAICAIIFSLVIIVPTTIIVGISYYSLF